MRTAMTDDAAETVLERKAQAQRKSYGAGAVSVPRALARSLSIAADALWGLGLGCRLNSDDTLSPDRACRSMHDDQMLLVLENDGGPSGLAAFDRSLVTGMIEVQTLGKVTAFPLDDRAFTPTDAAMMAPLLDAAFPRFASILSVHADLVDLAGFEFGALVEDRQTASLVLENEHYRVISFELDLANGTRSGRAVFCFPEPDKGADDDRASTAHGKYENVLKLVPARMHAVLTRIHIPLAKAQALRPGDVLPISPTAVASATLIFDGGHVAAQGKMGQMNGFRAMRIGEGQAQHKPAPAPSADVPLTAPDPIAPVARPATSVLTQPQDNGVKRPGSFGASIEGLAADFSDAVPPVT